jgi:hypothetical protein
METAPTKLQQLVEALPVSRAASIRHLVPQAGPAAIPARWRQPRPSRLRRHRREADASQGGGSNRHIVKDTSPDCGYTVHESLS